MITINSVFKYLDIVDGERIWIIHKISHSNGFFQVNYI